MKSIKVRPQDFTKGQNANVDTITNTIEREKEEAEGKSDKRKEKFVSILSNDPSNEFKYSEKIAIMFGSIVISFLPSLIYTMIPIHNVFDDQKYWYEFPLQMVFTVICFIFNTVLWASFYTNMTFFKTYRTVLIMVVVGLGVFLILEILGHVMWTKVAQYHHPIPFNGYAYIYLMAPAVYATLWYQFPRGLRQNETFIKRLRALIIALALTHGLPLLYYVIIKLMIVCPMKYQWVVALATPLLREFNIWISFKYAKQATNGDTKRAEIVCNQAMCCGHAYIMVCTLGAIATVETSALVLCIDFCINVYLCCRIIFSKRNRPMDTEKRIGLLQELIVNEIVEFMVPLAYLMVFVVGYYGPNAELIGTIRNDYWQYSPVDDIGYTIKCVMAFFFADLGSIFVSILLLWKHCRINLCRGFVAMHEEFGFAFTVQLASIVNFVSKSTIFLFILRSNSTLSIC